MKYTGRTNIYTFIMKMNTVMRKIRHFLFSRLYVIHRRDREIDSHTVNCSRCVCVWMCV